MTILVHLQKKTEVNIKFSNKSFQDFLHRPNADSSLITPTDAYEVNLIIYSLSSNKSTDPNNFATELLKL